MSSTESPKFTNRLIQETSPYLLQHAHNPVDWYAWKNEAFEKAKLENKPILVSIGYATCHWCHVMERESFENEEVARFLNENFVNIKVDREERPDVDQIYMEACQLINRSGGWPLNCFLLPDGKPFFAGTYYPPVQAYNRPSWIDLLTYIISVYKDNRETVEEQAEKLLGQISQKSDQLINFGQNKPDFKLDFKVNLDKVLAQADTIYGGFGGAPKFPSSMAIQALFDYHYYYGDQNALDHALFSLDCMLDGGIYDQLGGGFARYATDEAWIIPHFEKMLYDNALLVSTLSSAYKITKHNRYKIAIEETLSFVTREMMNEDGAFFAAIDADSEGVEGKFYVWSYQEIKELLQPEQFDLFCEFYNVTESGNWEGTNILHKTETLASFCKKRDLEEYQVKKIINSARHLLFHYRNNRIRPITDEKLLLDWNALMVSAFADAYSALGYEQYKSQAVQSLEFLLKEFKSGDDNSYFHTLKDNKKQYTAFLDDYANLIEAAIKVAQITNETDWLITAKELTDEVIEHFLTEQQNAFYFTRNNQQDIILRTIDLNDNATPSGNSTMANNLLKISVLFEEMNYQQIAEKMVFCMSPAIQNFPQSLSKWWSSAMLLKQGIAEIGIVGEDHNNYFWFMLSKFVPNSYIMSSNIPNEKQLFIKDKFAEDNQTNIYVCKNQTCFAPVNTVEECLTLLNTNQS